MLHCYCSSTFYQPQGWSTYAADPGGGAREGKVDVKLFLKSQFMLNLLNFEPLDWLVDLAGSPGPTPLAPTS